MSKILIIEDDDTMREGMRYSLVREGHDVASAEGGEEGLSLCKKKDFDLVITDYRMEPMNGIKVLEAVKKINPETDVVLITAYGTMELAIEAMNKGASDCVSKPLSLDEFRTRSKKVLQNRAVRQENQRLGEENRYLREQIARQYNFGEIIGQSKPMRIIFDQIRKIAPTDSSVLIGGESGTGKELVAHSIHNLSLRQDKPFIKVNCGALAESLLESELFGHEKGAFTNAIKRKRGKFELADGGSIFLDEIGDISENMQVKLLRVLQEKEIDIVGGEQTKKVDVRIIVATNRNLFDLVNKGEFREDLYYRLNVIPINLPPLRERKEDIPLLIDHFLQKKSAEMKKPVLRISQQALEDLSKYNWPGNIRELENLIERALVLCDGDEIQLRDFPLLLENGGQNILRLPEEDLPLDMLLENLERRLIERAMEKAGGVKTKTADILGIKTSALYYKLEKYKLIEM
ncbi:sigma-54-dependent Fis family transcriptional regulator [Candidatus Poribacteria bacterium]|nr:sigma-54-dependent Fis family transcriptional regulator [Candidatus Poribacteria bacterium]